MLADETCGSVVLIVDDDAVRISWLNSLLGSIDYQPQVIASDEIDSQLDNPVPDSQRPLMVIVGDSDRSEELIRRLKLLVDVKHMLVLLVSDQGQPMPDLPESIRDNLLGHITSPVRMVDLMQMLDQARCYFALGKQPGGQLSRTLTRTLVGISPCMQRLRQAIEKVAATSATVLITGETGTGKEVVARNVHYASQRREKPFVAVNCGAIPADLLESELFGHEKGSFTGAVTSRKGRFELAEGGTLFLDEIGDMPAMMQVKLLRVLQEGVFERVGSERSITADVRIIAATHQDLEDRIEKGMFRADLFYRLQVFPLETPPLRKRIEDLPILVNDLLGRQQRNNAPTVGIKPETFKLLSQYSWPGNVRELANLLERVTILYPYQEIDVQHLPQRVLDALGIEVTEAKFAVNTDDIEKVDISPTSLPMNGIDLKEHLAQLEIDLIQQALERSSFVVAHAAKLLGMRRTTLVEKVRKYGISTESETENESVI